MLFDVESRQTVLRLGAREIAIALSMFVALTGTFSGVTYVVGRATMPVQKWGPSEQPAEQVLVIEAPKNRTGGSDTVAPSGNDRTVAEAAVVMTPAHRSTEQRGPGPSKLYLQVAAADLGVAKVFVEYLSRRNFSSLIAEGPDERSYRVLVGPIQTDRQVEELRSGLEAAGFKPFLRRYSGDGVDETTVMYESDRESSSAGDPRSGRALHAQVASI